MILRGVEVVGERSPARSVVTTAGRITGDRPPFAGERVRELDGAIAFPGLVNSHDHLEFDLHPRLGRGPYADYVAWGDDIQRRDAATIASLGRVPRDVRLRWGALRNLLCGVTAVAHHGPARDAARRLPVALLPGTSIHSVGLAPRWRWRLNEPFARPPYVLHVGEGTSARASAEVDRLVRWNLLRRPLVGVHAIGMRPEQAAAFRAIVWCPVSNAFLYGAGPDVASLKRRTSILFGTDSTLTGGWNLWDHLRRARASGGLDDAELFEAVTGGAARVWGRGAETLAPGQPADLVVARKKNDDRHDAFFAVDPEDVLLVLRDGTPVLSDAVLGLTSSTGAPSSRIRIGERDKLVSEDVPALTDAIVGCGVELNIPIGVASRRSRGGPS
jgi:cytosine/adenosine deaminase-related metal-dependent hydrolase